jgi:hypothetical protein
VKSLPLFLMFGTVDYEFDGVVPDHLKFRPLEPQAKCTQVPDSTDLVPKEISNGEKVDDDVVSISELPMGSTGLTQDFDAVMDSREHCVQDREEVLQDIDDQIEDTFVCIFRCCCFVNGFFVRSLMMDFESTYGQNTKTLIQITLLLEIRVLFA